MNNDPSEKALADMGLPSPALAEFLSSPPRVQDQFFAALAAQEQAETAYRHWLSAMDSDDPCPPPYPSMRAPRVRVQWDERWQRRARIASLVPKGAGEDAFAKAARETELLKSIDASVYIEALTGEVTDRGRTITCPLPDHDDRSPSFHFGETGWRCYACNRSGTIYDLAGYLWGIEPRGAGFTDLHRQLMAIFG